MRRIVAPVLLLAFAAILISCSGSKIMPTPAMPNIGGAWEFIATSSSSTGHATGIEVALQQGTVFVNDGYNPDGQISASGTQLSFVGLTAVGQNKPPGIAFGGNCTPSGANSLTGSISGLGGSMNFTFTENGFVYNVTAILDASGKLIDSGTYTLQSGTGGCGGDTGGTLTGEIVSKLSGTYTGQVCQLSDTTCTNPRDTATATLSQSGTTLTVNLLLTGVDNTSLTLTGPVTGNSFFVQGTYQGTALSYDGYVQYVFDSVDGLYDTPTVYIENVACDPALYTCGNLLTVPLVP